MARRANRADFFQAIVFKQSHKAGGLSLHHNFIYQICVFQPNLGTGFFAVVINHNSDGTHMFFFFHFGVKRVYLFLRFNSIEIVLCVRVVFWLPAGGNQHHSGKGQQKYSCFHKRSPFSFSERATSAAFL